MPPRVRITDVSPRDGLQNEPIGDHGPIPTERKADLVRAAAATSVDEVELTSFVSPKWVPQLGDAAHLCALIADEARAWTCTRSALVPNERGLDALLEANARAGFPLINKLSVFTAASETFSRRNTNATIDETLERFEPVARRAADAGLALRGYISCAVACPFEGPIEPEAVARVAASLAALGIHDIDLGDTIGKATPDSITAVINTVAAHLGPPGDADDPRLTIHLHDTFGGAAACVEAAIALGVRSFDAAFGGLGGCPYASTDTTRAPGNIAMRTLLDTIEHAGCAHTVDRAAAAHATELALDIRSTA
ncbi:MAG: hydroxymethylglutaryl-CoA lyase [Planctomycetota bacterium]